MTDKTQPLGICDHCGGPINDSPYSKNGKPRRDCSRECRNTANSRNGNPARVEKLKHAIARGEWKNPILMESPESRKAHASIAGRKGRLREVAEGRWRNPALDDQARAKLSRPRTITDPLVHRAMEMMRQGVKSSELPDDLHSAFNAYQRERTKERGDELRAKIRAWYHHRKSRMTPEQIEQQRAKWRADNKKRSANKKQTPTG